MLNYDAINEELGRYNITLYERPEQFGIGSINEKLAKARAIVSRIAEIRDNVAEHENLCKKEYIVAKEMYEKAIRGFMNLDEDVRKQKSKEMRESLAIEKASEKLEDMNQKELKHIDAKSFKLRVDDRIEIWSDTINDIKAQLRTIEAQIVVREITEDSIKQTMQGRILKLKKKEGE